MRAYFTSADCELRFRTHAGDSAFDGLPLDAAHFVLTAGESPVHIWNYAYRESDTQDYNTHGSSGGATFDDTALGHHFCRLRIIMNMERKRDVRAQLTAMTEVGDLELRYQARPHAWETESPLEESGYLLREGHVAQVGEEYTLENATFPSITLQFKECLPLEGNHTLYRESPDDSEPIEPEESSPQEGLRIRLYRAYYEHQGTRRPYDPRFRQTIGFYGAELLPEVEPGRWQVEPFEDIESLANGIGYLEPLIEVEGKLLAYNPKEDRYEPATDAVKHDLLNQAQREACAPILFQ